MNSVECRAYAKINLSIDVIGKRPDGYHNVRMLMQQISLYDIVRVTEKESGIEVVCDFPGVPSGEKNIAWKAAKALLDKYKIDKGLSIDIMKNIPAAAGLAGGSADAAAVLKSVNNIFSMGLSMDELCFIGKNVGADVPFCILGGTALAEGIGEILTPIPPLPPCHILLVKPPIEVSTAWVYGNLALDELHTRPDTELLIRHMKSGNITGVAENMENVLENVTIKGYSIIRELKDKLLELGAAGSVMSGSGPTVFGIFSTKSKAEDALNIIKSTKDANSFITVPV